MVQLFDSLVGSILLYASEVWGFHEAKNVNLIQNKFCRKVLGVKKSTNLIGMYGELGILPLSVIRKFNMIKFWAHIINNPNSLQFKVYQTLHDDVNGGNTYNGQNWAYQVKSILEELGLPYMFTEHDTRVPLQEIKTRLRDQYMQQWRSGLEESSRLHYYCTLKETWEFERYLDIIDDTLLRKVITRLRLSSHNLAIETGRYDGTPRHLRKCTNCSSDAVETEYHFLLVCTAYSDLRKKYFAPYFCHWPSTQKFKAVLSLRSKMQLKNLGRFILEADKRRS
jgi:hypothetical protein